MQDPLSTSIERKVKIPKSIPFIIGNEFAERFSFYGMRSIIAVFLVQQFFRHEAIDIANAKANAYNHAFSTLVYFTPFLGAILADWFFGKYRVILIGSLIYTVGHFLLAMFDTSLPGFTVGLIVIAFSAGAIKSCVSANVGDQFDHHNEKLMSSIYSWFYFAINSGSLVGLLFIPIVYSRYGAAWAFGIPGVLMAAATIIFFAGRNTFVKNPATGIKKDNFVTVNCYVLWSYFTKKDKDKTAWQMATEKYGEEKITAFKAVWRVMAVFAFTPIFWAMWDMNGSEWVLQATKLDLNLGIYDIHILPSQVQFVNALFLLLCIPIFNYGVYPLVEKMGIKLTPLRKIGAGLLVTGGCFVIIAILQKHVDAGAHPSIWWQILAYLLLSAAEVLVSLTCLEYAYTQSPPSMKSTMTAIWYLMYAVGTLFTTMINVNISNKGIFSHFIGDGYYWLFVYIILGFFVLFLFISPRIKEKRFLVERISDGLNIKDNATQKIHPDNPIV